jgi:hypothetical protein
MKTGPDTFGTAENESGEQNMKTAPKALGTAENENGRPKHEIGTALDTAENESKRIKYENGTRRPQYRRKRVWARKT